MNPQKTWFEKIEKEMEQARDKLAEFKTQPRSLTAEDRIKHFRHIEELEQRVVEARAQWQELNGVSDDVWRQMKGKAESTWRALQEEIQEVITDVQT